MLWGGLVSSQALSLQASADPVFLVCFVPSGALTEDKAGLWNGVRSTWSRVPEQRCAQAGAAWVSSCVVPSLPTQVSSPCLHGDCPVGSPDSVSCSLISKSPWRLNFLLPLAMELRALPYISGGDGSVVPCYFPEINDIASGLATVSSNFSP